MITHLDPFARKSNVPGGNRKVHAHLILFALRVKASKLHEHSVGNLLLCLEQTVWEMLISL